MQNFRQMAGALSQKMVLQLCTNGENRAPHHSAKNTHAVWKNTNAIWENTNAIWENTNAIWENTNAVSLHITSGTLGALLVHHFLAMVHQPFV